MGRSTGQPKDMVAAINQYLVGQTAGQDSLLQTGDLQSEQ